MRALCDVDGTALVLCDQGVGAVPGGARVRIDRSGFVIVYPGNGLVCYRSDRGFILAAGRPFTGLEDGYLADIWTVDVGVGLRVGGVAVKIGVGGELGREYLGGRFRRIPPVMLGGVMFERSSERGQVRLDGGGLRSFGASTDARGGDRREDSNNNGDDDKLDQAKAPGRSGARGACVGSWSRQYWAYPRGRAGRVGGVTLLSLLLKEYDT